MARSHQSLTPGSGGQARLLPAFEELNAERQALAAVLKGAQGLLAAAQRWHMAATGQENVPAEIVALRDALVSPVLPRLIARLMV